MNLSNLPFSTFNDAKSNDTESLRDTSSPRRSSTGIARFKGALRIAFWPFLLSRLWVFVFAYWGHFQYANVQGRYLVPFKGGWEGVPNWWLNPWTTYDSERFVHVAERGYDVVTSVSFPLYSVLLIPFNRSETAMAAWGFGLSNAFFLLGLAMLYLLTKRDFGSETVARGTLWATAFFPATVIFSAVYAESLFFLLLVLTFWEARAGRWWRAALWAFLLGLTRNSGPILFVALAIEYSMQWKSARDQGRETPPLVCALATTSPLVAFVAFQFYLKHTLGGSDLVLKQAHALGRDWIAPWIPVWREILFIAQGRSDVGTLVNFWATLTGIVVAFAFWKRGLSYTAFLGGMLLAFLTYGMTYPPYTIGAMRYLAPTFPLQQRLAMTVSAHAQRPLTRLILISVALIASATVAYGFGAKHFLF